MSVFNFDTYQKQRGQTRSFFSYGLRRRSLQAGDEFQKWIEESNTPHEGARIIDFGCGDARMLDCLNDRFPTSISCAVGLDSFKKELPPVIDGEKISLARCDLRQTPYDFPNDSFDFAIVSAFLKHNPVPVPFLREIDRLLSHQGRVVLLDPTPTIVRLGIFLKYFDPRYTPFPWSPASLTKILARENFNLRLVRSYRYWLAPNQRMFDLAQKNWCPDSSETESDFISVPFCKKMERLCEVCQPLARCNHHEHHEF